MTPPNTIKEKLESFKSRFTPLAMVLRWMWNGVKWGGLVLTTIYAGIRYLQWEMRAIAVDVVTPQIRNVETKHDQAMKYMEYRFNENDKKVDRMDGKIDRLLERK